MMSNYWKLSKKQKAEFVMIQLKKDYPIVETPLTHSNEFQLLVAVMLSAQTLDDTTNKVTPELFKNFPNVKSLANAKVEDVQKIIKRVNYYKTKSMNLIKMAQKLLQDFDGKVPSSLEQLTTLPGVGRKTANVVISEWFVKKQQNIPEGFVVDTHVLRVSKNLGLTLNSDPKKVEKDLMKLFPRSEWPDMSLRLIFHGRYLAKSRGAKWNEHKVWKKIYDGKN